MKDRGQADAVLAGLRTARQHRPWLGTLLVRHDGVFGAVVRSGATPAPGCTEPGTADAGGAAPRVAGQAAGRG
ncbi:MAG TPA: hypothetical protein VG253_04195 [Streptosporangiaceae bacterium]|jgi:hypothetical protein|nr:hypothetical protein [Streptosporangiaceae bacterium]